MVARCVEKILEAFEAKLLSPIMRFSHHFLRARQPHFETGFSKIHFFTMFLAKKSFDALHGSDIFTDVKTKVKRIF